MSLLAIRGLEVAFGTLRAVDGIDLDVPEGSTIGLVGESGSGKSTVARAIVGLVRARSGRVVLDGADVTNARGAALRQLRARVQMVFQDPASSLNPRMTVGEAVEEAVAAHRVLRRAGRAEEALRLFELVHLDPSLAPRYPHQLSGGQRQRVAIARSLAARPKLLVLDEVTSSLDVSVQANVLNLLRSLQRELGLTYLFISHNLSVVRYMSDHAAVMYLGRIVEHGPTARLFAAPRHPYTRTLLDALPSFRARIGMPLRLMGEAPDPRFPPPGCRFHTRCPVGPLVRPERRPCVLVDPTYDEHGARRDIACHYPLVAAEVPRA